MLEGETQRDGGRSEGVERLPGSSNFLLSNLILKSLTSFFAYMVCSY